jgi:2',3'-cyclic-nucleotide 2'-phosphodiesterase (5'-nucleotidase family)
MELHLLHTNDVHSHLDEYLILASQIRQLRSQLKGQGQTVFLFDIGDHADRMRPETDGTMGLINASLLRIMNYDAWVFGNNEGLIIPRRHWQELCAESGTSVLGSNLREMESGQPLPFFQDTLLIERKGVRLGVIGVTAPYNDYYNMEGIEALPPFNIIPPLIKRLRDQGADIVVLLSHLGLAVDRRIGGELPGLDLIIGSHTHNLLEQPERAGDSWVVQAGKFANYFGHVVIDFDETARQIRDVTGSVVPRDETVRADADLLETMRVWGRRADTILDRTIADVPEELAHHYHEESDLANLVADEMLELSHADLALLNSGVFLFGLERGPLSRRTLLACCPSPINPIVMKLSGRQIRSVLEQALDPEHTRRRGMGFGFRGKEIGSLAIAGMRVSYGPGGAIDEVDVNGEALAVDRMYQVVTADYLYFSGVYDEFARGEKIRFEPYFLREILERAITVPYKIRRAKVRRWLPQRLLL